MIPPIPITKPQTPPPGATWCGNTSTPSAPRGFVWGCIIPWSTGTIPTIPLTTTPSTPCAGRTSAGRSAVISAAISTICTHRSGSFAPTTESWTCSGSIFPTTDTVARTGVPENLWRWCARCSPASCSTAGWRRAAARWEACSPVRPRPGRETSPPLSRSCRPRPCAARTGRRSAGRRVRP